MGFEGSLCRLKTLDKEAGLSICMNGSVGNQMQCAVILLFEGV